MDASIAVRYPGRCSSRIVSFEDVMIVIGMPMVKSNAVRFFIIVPFEVGFV